MTESIVTPEESAAIIDWLQTQRWYADKSRALDSCAFASLGTVDCDTGRIDLLTVDCAFSDGGQSSYFVPLQIDRSLVDAFQISAFLEWFASGFPQRRSVQSGDQTMTWIAGSDSEVLEKVARSARLIRSEQSNTSFIFGDRAIAKVFRRLQPGLNPDVEIIQYLTEQTDYRHVPTHVGTLIIESRSPTESITLASVQGFVANQGDGWIWLLGELEAHTNDSADVLLNAIELLGMRTAELHIALARSTTDPSFVAVPMTEGDTDDLAKRLNQELDQTISSLNVFGARSVHELTMLRKGIVNKLASVHELLGLPKTRVHGDYHLGQVLRTPTGFAIIDFEGEPSRSIIQRRQKVSPLKDVAGMLRSLDYAVATSERAHARIEAFPVREWGKNARLAFLQGYTASIQTSPTEIVPTCEPDFEAALDLFMIEKAMYEIRYELDNRPGWLEIPLRALETLVGQAKSGPETPGDGPSVPDCESRLYPMLE